ncbi:histidine kinase dimerization/phospho-acceptor domain-containing protein [Spirochaeta isovalerica]|uniref:histidine kinase n=1 Tax=Spirochaeta isovalerica TaxID=150 RepID=A0A841RIP0_9SPIO|nr:histidine kinase dimerization/phospho-acceptor domain-containing protein [Spirochaeta isovalerica]MBB6482172.1 signal transduction histidine kinase [Spirochaeta isovalerica]
MNYYTRYITVHSEVESRLREGVSVYFKEFEIISQKCQTIVSIYSEKDFVIDHILNGDNPLFRQDIIDFYRMGVVDIIEIEDAKGEVIFRGHNPDRAGDSKIDQQLIQEGLDGNESIGFESGQTGFAIRAVAPIKNNRDIIGLFMAGERFSDEFVDNLKTLTLLENGIYRNNSKVVSTYDGLEILDETILAKLKKGEIYLGDQLQINGSPYHAIIKPIFSRGDYWGAVCLGISQQESERIFQYSNRQVIYIVLGGILLALVIYFLLARNINSSLEKVITGITNYSFDHPNLPIELEESDEFGIIARNFNDLIYKIEIYNKRIETLQNDLLKSAKLATAGQIAANLAHEIRNPLSSIKMMAQIVRSRYLKGPSGREEMDIILEEIDRINIKVKELLEFAKPSRMDFSRQDIHPIIDSLLNLLAYNLSENEINLTKDFDPGLPDLYVDGEKIRICFMNIIVNAVQAMPNGGELTISTKRFYNKAYITICNSCERELETDKFFEPFYTTKEDGTGLGLAISKLEIDRHNGDMEVSMIDGFICFKIILPLNDYGEDEYYG